MPGDLNRACTDGPNLGRARLLASLAGARRCLLAVSGGADSMALLHLAATWREAPPLSVATIDHGLRPEAAQEARDVAAAAHRCGLPHTTLTWTQGTPGTRLQERARTARYDLLLQHAQAIGADRIVTAHHADDQAETILFRLLRGSGLAGLTGMRTARPLGALVLLRPLLGLTKAELVAVCATAGFPYVDDPSNVDPTFARGRLRQLAPHFDALGLDRATLLRLGRRLARADQALAVAATDAADRLAALRTAGTFSIDCGSIAALPDEIALRILDREIARIGGATRLRLERLERIAAGLAAAQAAGATFAATLAGTLVRRDARGRLTIRLAPPRRTALA